VLQKFEIVEANIATSKYHSTFNIASSTCPACFHDRPQPRSRPQKLCYVHCPKCGTSFYNTVQHFACPKLPENCLFIDGPSSCRRASNAAVRIEVFSKSWHNDSVPFDIRLKENVPLNPLFCSATPKTPMAYLEHYHHPWNASICEADSVAMMFRKPVERMISQYMDKDRRDVCSDIGIADCALLPHANACMTRMLNGEECRGSWISRSAQLIKSFEGHGNLTDALYSSLSSYLNSKLMTKQVARALRAIEDLRFVGLTDHWMESVCLFHAMHGSEPTAAEFVNTRANGTNFWQAGWSPRSGITHYDEKALMWRDPIDEEIFRAALSRFNRDLAKFTTCQPVPVG